MAGEKLSKSDLVDRVKNHLGEETTTKQAEAAYEAVVSAITDTLKGGDQFNLMGVGTFSVKNIPAKTGSTPAGPYSKPAHIAPKFSASNTLKKALN